jgi:dTDP-4-amino-4,6-dideoxygalactose transaminase
VRHAQRDALQQALSESDIGTLIHYPTPPHLQEAYSHFGLANLPLAERLADEVLSLPIGPQFGPQEAAAVIEAVRKAVA